MKGPRTLENTLMKLDSAKLLCSSDRVKRAGDDKDLISEPIGEFALRSGAVSVPTRPFEITTVKVLSASTKAVEKEIRRTLYRVEKCTFRFSYLCQWEGPSIIVGIANVASTCGVLS